MASNVVLIAGPGGYAFSHEHIEKTAAALTAQGANVITVGNGELPISVKDIEEAMSRAQLNGEPTTLFVMAHGGIKEGKHSVDLDGKFGLTSEQLFKTAARIFKNKPVDTFMTSCHGGAAILEIENLPKGSTLATLAPGSEDVKGTDVERLVNNIGKGEHKGGDFSARNLLEIYLTKSLKNRIAPSMAVAGGGGVYDLPVEFKERLGKPFSETERQKAHNTLDKLMKPADIDTLMNKIAGARDEWSISAAEFGSALAISLATSSRAKDLALYDPNRASHADVSGGIQRKGAWENLGVMRITGAREIKSGAMIDISANTRSILQANTAKGKQL